MNHRASLRIALLLAVAFVAACATSPTGRKQVITVNESSMERMGEQAFRQLRAQTPPSYDRQANAIIKCIADYIVAELPPDQRHGWEVVVFDQNQVNAFALPGRKIGVYEGIFRAARNQHQLAGVIGHEIGHVLARHAAERVSTSQVADIGVQVAQAAASGTTGATRDAMGLLGVGVQVGVLMPFGRAQESEADIIGLELMAKAGFDPRETIPLWENMGRVGGQAPPEFLSTHPSRETRSRELEEHMPVALGFFDEARARGLDPDCGF